MDNRKTIKTALKEAIQNKVNTINGYNTDIREVKVGINDSNEFTSLPALGFWIVAESVNDDLMDDYVDVKVLKIIMYGYIDDDRNNEWNHLDDFIIDMQKFLLSDDNPYNLFTKIGDITSTYGGIEKYIGMFILNFTIQYEQEI